jgi:A/G-specific adenine glycosylase
MIERAMDSKEWEWTSRRLSLLRKRAVEWFHVNGRDLPWRRTSDPYAIWISEIMLQQTQVATVIPYYQRFLKSFPKVNDLAKASLDEVYQHWAGLGYYRRARQLHDAAKIVSETHSGIFPTSHQDVSKLPGIGRYTVGAILSFATDQRQPIVEANTQRLYARLLHWPEDLASKNSQNALWTFAEQVLPAKSGSGIVNQSLMEIGSQICTAKSPNCMACPLNSLCPTFANGSQAMIPAPKKPKIYTELKEGALIIRDDRGCFLMRRCSADERWAGLWDFPRFDVTDHANPSSAKRKLRQEFSKKFQHDVLIGRELNQLKHAVTRYRITLQSYEAILESTPPKKWVADLMAQGLEVRWLNAEELSELAVNSSANRLRKMLFKNGV